MRLARKFSKSRCRPTFRHKPDIGFLLRFAAEALGEELVQERLFQFRGHRDQPLLLLQRPLHQPQHPRNLPLLGDGRNWNRQSLQLRFGKVSNG